MADDDPARHLLVLNHRAAHLLVHFQNGRRRDLRIIRCGGELFRKRCVRIFKVRQIDIDQSLQGPQCLDRFVAAAVIHDRHRQLRRKRREDGRQKVRRRDEIDVLTALVDQPLERGAKLL